MMANLPDDRSVAVRLRRLFGLLPVALPVALVGALSIAPARAGETVAAVPAPALDEARQASAPSEVVVLAGGCFWGVQAVFQHVNGVRQAVSGYAGGTKESA